MHCGTPGCPESTRSHGRSVLVGEMGGASGLLGKLERAWKLAGWDCAFTRTRKYPISMRKEALTPPPGDLSTRGPSWPFFRLIPPLLREMVSKPNDDGRKSHAQFVNLASPDVQELQKSSLLLI